MQPIVTIISILFVILHTSSINCFKFGFNRVKSIHRHKSSLVLCPDGLIPIEGRCESILPGDPACSNDHILVKGHCRKIYAKGNGVCDDNYETIGTNCVELIPGYHSCRIGQKLVDGLCRNTLHPHFSCPEGSRMIQGSCYRRWSRKPICPEGYEVIENRCREKVREIVECPEGQKLVNGNCEEIATTTTTTTTTKPEPCPEGTKRINNICTGRAKPCGTRFKRVFGECRYIDPHSYLCTPGFEWIHGRCRFGHM